MAKPVWPDIVSHILGELRSGSIPPGGRLPSGGETAVRLGVSRNTVLRAYRELERLGWVEIRYGDGTFARIRCEGEAEAPHAAQIDAWAATLGLRVNPWAIAWRRRNEWKDAAPGVGGRRRARRRITRRERVWLGHRMRALVRDALEAGLEEGDVEALLRAAVAWERHLRPCEGAAPCGRERVAAGEARCETLVSGEAGGGGAGEAGSGGAGMVGATMAGLSAVRRRRRGRRGHARRRGGGRRAFTRAKGDGHGP